MSSLSESVSTIKNFLQAPQNLLKSIRDFEKRAEFVLEGQLHLKNIFIHSYLWAPYREQDTWMEVMHTVDDLVGDQKKTIASPQCVGLQAFCCSGEGAYGTLRRNFPNHAAYQLYGCNGGTLQIAREILTRVYPVYPVVTAGFASSPIPANPSFYVRVHLRNSDPERESGSSDPKLSWRRSDPHCESTFSCHRLLQRRLVFCIDIFWCPFSQTFERRIFYHR